MWGDRLSILTFSPLLSGVGKTEQERALEALQAQVTELEKELVDQKENRHTQAEAKEQVVELKAQVRSVRRRAKAGEVCGT